MEISLWSFPKETVKGTYWISFGVCIKILTYQKRGIMDIKTKRTAWTVDALAEWL